MENTITDVTEIRICTEMDVLRARKQAVRQAATMGFRDIAQAEIEIAVSELGTNIVKHARSQGSLWISPAQAGQSMGLKIIARNLQPTHDQDRDHQKSSLMRGDGVSTAGTLGIGISGVRRLMDEFDVAIDTSGHLIITTIKWLIKGNWNRANCSVVSRPIMGEPVSGDAYYIRHLSDGFIFGVIEGYTVDTYNDPVMALEHFRTRSRDYDLVITDMSMPTLSGLVLSRELKKIRDDIPIILCTGHNSLEDDSKYADFGISALVLKPFARKELIAVIETVCTT